MQAAASMRNILVSCCLIFTLTISNAAAKVIYHAKNEFGPLWVHEEAHSRMLSFVPDNSIFQSMIKLDQPDVVQFEYIRFLLSSLLLNKAPEHILLLGLGGGTAAKAINTLLPQAKLDVVEINPLIPRVAEKFFLYTPNNNTQITVGDGYQFALNAKGLKYDLIIIDVFDKNYIPAPFLTKKFVENVERILNNDGVVAVNTFEQSKFSVVESKLYHDSFRSFYELKNGSSRIIIAKKGIIPTPAQVKEKAKGWAFNLYQVGINAGDIAEKFKLAE
jgi:spermidine synthase